MRKGQKDIQLPSYDLSGQFDMESVYELRKNDAGNDSHGYW